MTGPPSLTKETNRPCQDTIEICCNIPETSGGGNTNISPRILNEPTGCGLPAAFFRISGKGDNEAHFGEFPWMVALLEQTNGRNIFLGGGSLIHFRVVLTAAHIINGKEGSSLLARAGEWNTQQTDEMYLHKDRDVDEIQVHPEFYKPKLENDIALLFLDNPFVLQPHISPICLPPQNTRFHDIRCLASGWGKDNFGKEGMVQMILKKVDLPIVSNNQCEKLMRATPRLGHTFQLSDSFICAGGEAGKDTCKGDGGSALVCPISGTDPQRFYQSGIVSWGIGCNQYQLPGAYVNVAKFRRWIDDQMKTRNLDSSQYTYDE